MTRKLPFTTIENLRDFGDYAAGHRHMRKGVLFRSAHQAEASDEELEALSRLGLSLIVDLRRPGERERNPSRRWKDFAAEVIANDHPEEDDDPWRRFMASGAVTSETMRAYMLTYYDNAPHDPRHLDTYSRWFARLGETEGATLVHCAAGKDRTGILCALTHHIAGVHPDDIMADYLLTNDEERFARRIPQFAAHVEELTGHRPDDEALRTAMGVEAAYLERAWTAMKERHGSIDGYLREALGVDDARRAAVERRILV
ncbi:MAG TPA: tyrosine-protein phosphatase [Caulobacter sp.]|nr:tyrosine-protein phosphatase [Caulobacter sp.]